MKIIATSARWLLGLVFLVFGLNGFLHCIPMPPAWRRGSIPGGALCLPLSGRGVSAPVNSGCLAPAESLCPARANSAGSRHREHLVVSLVHGARLPAAGAAGHRALAPGVPERPLGLRESVPGACLYAGIRRLCLKA